MPPDFSDQNLRGRNFKGQDLTGANFSYADIRGTNFSNAILIGANFTKAKAGMQRHWEIILVIVSLILSILSGFVWAYAGTWVAITVTSKNPYSIIGGLVNLLALPMFFVVSIRQGIMAALATMAWVGAALVMITGVLAASWLALLPFGLADDSVLVMPLTVALGGSGALTVFVVVIGVLAGSGTLAIADVLAGNNFLVVNAVMAMTITITVTNHLADNLVKVWVSALDRIGAGTVIITMPLGMPLGMAIVVAVLAIYIARCALAENTNYIFIHKIAVFFVAMGGTSFCDANLTDANFTESLLKCTKISGANLTRTCFYKVKKLHLARVDKSILDNLSIRNLLVTGNGRNKSYLGANLRGANLIGADLSYANLKEADITDSTFRGANLEWSNLTLAQAIGTDFTSAQMTGACLEGWNIESNANLDNVDCRFIYLLEYPKPETDDRERRPSSGEFKPGEFTKLFEEVLTTVDLIFDKGIDWKAFVAAFKKVQVENEDTEFAIQSIENKRDGVIVVRVSVSPDTDKEKIHSNFTQNYTLALKAVEEKYKAELQAKDKEIQIYREKSVDMKEIIGLLATRPINVNNEVVATSDSKSMTDSSDSSRKIEIDKVGGNISGHAALNLGEIEINGTVANTIGQVQTSDAPEGLKLAELLQQLQIAIEAENNLSDEDKAEALKQVITLAEAGKNPQELSNQRSAKTAMKILKGTVASLPRGASLVENCDRLLPTIAKILGLSS